jgi:hypothetical protein
MDQAEQNRVLGPGTEPTGRRDAASPRRDGVVGAPLTRERSRQDSTVFPERFSEAARMN